MRSKRRKRKQRPPNVCDACGDRTRRLLLRGGRRSCRGCFKLSTFKWVSAVLELDRIQHSEAQALIAYVGTLAGAGILAAGGLWSPVREEA